MALTKYTQADFAALKRGEDGYIKLPRGDWSEVAFGGADGLHIAAGSILGNGCKLGDGCMLGYRCMLGNGCHLGDGCVLGDGCRLGNWCELGNGCTLGDGCMLGDGCELGRRCKLGAQCALGDRCTLEGGRVPNATYYIVTNIGSRNDSAFAYCNTATGEIYVRAGCWFGGIDEFIARVHEVHAGTQHESDYIAFAEFARARYARYKVNNNDG